MRSIFRNALRRNARERCERALPYDRSKAKCAAFFGMPSDEMPESSANGRFLMDRRLGMEMGDSGKKIYVGIDLDGDVAMVSFSYENGEPETVSPFTGSEIFSIPMAVCLKRDEGGWAYGEEARRIAKAGLGHCEERLFERACRGEQVQMGTKLYALSDLLAMFLKKMVTLAGRLGPKISLSQLVITTRTLDAGVIEMLREVAGAMQLTGAQVHFIDYKQSFFYYGSAQAKNGAFHDMGLFEYHARKLQFWCLESGKRSRPQLLSIREERYGFEAQQADELFAQIIPQALGKQIVTMIYLVGDGFESGWMKESLKLLCQGRRVFLGKNLFSKGACYAAKCYDSKKTPEYVYIGEHEMKSNVSLKVYERGNLSFYTLVTAGVPWFEPHKGCEVILDDLTTIDFWIQRPDSREARIEAVELAALPKREKRTSRIAIDVKPCSDHEVKLTLTDVGLGELVPGSGKKWEYELLL